MIYKIDQVVEEVMNNFQLRLEKTIGKNHKQYIQFISFNEAYKLTKIICSSNEYFLLPNDKEFQCRICGATGKENFTKKAHVIPQFLGRANIVSKIEYDSCNKLFQKYESSLGTLTEPQRALLGQKKKSHNKNSKHFPVYKKNGVRASMLTEKQQSKLQDENKDLENINLDKHILIESKEEILFNKKKETELTFPIGGFIPVHAFKVFVKIYLLLIDEVELKKMIDTREWLKCESKHNLDGLGSDLVLIIHTYNKHMNYFEFPEIWLFERRADLKMQDGIEISDKLMIMFFGNSIYQTIIPFTTSHLSALKNGKKVRTILYPSILNPINILCQYEKENCIKTFLDTKLSPFNLKSFNKAKNFFYKLPLKQ